MGHLVQEGQWLSGLLLALLQSCSLEAFVLWPWPEGGESSKGARQRAPLSRSFRLLSVCLFLWWSGLSAPRTRSGAHARSIVSAWRNLQPLLTHVEWGLL